MTSKDLAALLPTLDRLNLRVLLHTVLNIKTEEELQHITPTQAIKAGLWEFMRAIGFVTDGQARLVLDWLSPILDNVIPQFSADHATLPVLHLTFAEQRWVGFSSKRTWYDMLFNTQTEELPEPAVLLVVCDVTALYLRQCAWLKKLKKEDGDAKS